jgi:hypothetical protein
MMGRDGTGSGWDVSEQTLKIYHLSRNGRVGIAHGLDGISWNELG